jgi:SAM-dependent methyltransferase
MAKYPKEVKMTDRSFLNRAEMRLNRLRQRLRRLIRPEPTSQRVTTGDIEKALLREREWVSQQIRDSEKRLIESVYSSTRRTHDNGQPRGDPLADALREIAMLRWGVKLLGVKLASELYAAGKSGHQAEIPTKPQSIGLTSKICCQSDIEAEWFRYWCGQLHVVPIYSRKLWEYAFVLQVLWEAGYLDAGHAGLGFAVGTEPLPSLFASRGLSIVATDLDLKDQRTPQWHQSGQHSAAIEDLFKPDLVDRPTFLSACKFRAVDMTEIPNDFDNAFDFCWSMCSFEHIGSIERGLEFVQNSIKCLKPGGIAIHTTEYNFEIAHETADNCGIVLFQRRHIEELGRRLAVEGHMLRPVDFSSGSGMLDYFIDVPPYPFWDGSPHLPFHPETPHMRFSIFGFPATVIGLIVRAAT